jgi:hypothetical protein
MAGAANFSPVRDVVMAKIVACKFALASAKLYGISRTIVETDSTLLREWLITDSRDLAPERVLLRGIRELLTDEFSCVCIRSVPRSCNVVAHEVAKLSMNWDLGQSDVWLDPILEFVNSLVARNLAEHMVLNEGP